MGVSEGAGAFMKSFARILLFISAAFFIGCSAATNNVAQSTLTLTFTMEPTVTLTPNVPRTIAAKLTKAAAPHATAVAQANSIYNAQQTLTALVPTQTLE